MKKTRIARSKEFFVLTFLFSTLLLINLPVREVAWGFATHGIYNGTDVWGLTSQLGYNGTDLSFDRIFGWPYTANLTFHTVELNYLPPDKPYSSYGSATATMGDLQAFASGNITAEPVNKFEPRGMNSWFDTIKFLSETLEEGDPVLVRITARLDSIVDISGIPPQIYEPGSVYARSYVRLTDVNNIYAGPNLTLVNYGNNHRLIEIFYTYCSVGTEYWISQDLLVIGSIGNPGEPGPYPSVNFQVDALDSASLNIDILTPGVYYTTASGYSYSNAVFLSCDFNHDFDVDGSDLAFYISDSQGITIQDLANKFGQEI